MKKIVIMAAALLGLAAAAPLSASAEETAAQKWFTDENGKIFCYGEDGEFLTGIQTIDGEEYSFAANGVLKTGWRTVNGKRRYYDIKTGKPVYGWVDYCGKQYYIDPEEGGKASGPVTDEKDDSYLISEFGYALTESGFNKYNDEFYYVGADGKLLTQPTEIAGVVYNISEKGVVGTGWQESGDKTLYFDPETAEAKFGTLTLGDATYYISKSKGKVTGEEIINDIPFLFDEEGKLCTGWQVTGGKRRFYYDNMTVATGLVEINGMKYILANDGTPLVGRRMYAGKKYFTNEDGAVQYGFILINEKQYFFGEDGAMVTGWVEIEGKKRYFDESKGMLTGRQIIQGVKYALDDEGVPRTGLVSFADGDYFFDEDGKIHYGWAEVGSEVFYFDPESGKKATHRVVDGLWLDEEGKICELSLLQKEAEGIISKIGADAESVFNYVVANNSYKLVEPTKPLDQIESIGWDYFAQTALHTRFVVCYYFAAVTDLLFQQAGYETRIVYGTGRGSGDHYWNQIKVKGEWRNYDTCNGYMNVDDEFLVGKKYTWDDKRCFIYTEYNTLKGAVYDEESEEEQD